MNPLISEISQNLPQPSDFGVGNSEYNQWEKEIERLKKMPEQYSYIVNFLGAVAIVVSFFLGDDFREISALLFLFSFYPMIWGRKYTREYEKVRNKISELESKKAEVDNKYRSAFDSKKGYIDEILSQYKDAYLYRKRSSSYGFAEKLQIYSDAVEHFYYESSWDRYWTGWLTEHRNYVSSRNIKVTPYKRPSQQSENRPQATEHKASTQSRQEVREVKQNPITISGLKLENTIDIPAQQAEQQFNNGTNQSASSSHNREKSNMIIGDTGEEAVADYERNLFQKRGRDSLADRVEVVSKTIGDGLGYDVLSFDKYGNKKFIEVKTTRSNGLTANFSFTRGELNFLINNPDTAFVYCVFGITGNNPRLKIYPASRFLDKSFETVEYRATVS